MKRRVVLGQLGWAYDNEVWLPTAAGMLAAHCRSSDEFNAAYDIDPWLRYEREEPEACVESMVRRSSVDIRKIAPANWKGPLDIGLQDFPDVVALSHYVWNEQLNFAVLREMKRRCPGVLTVLGGPSVGEAGPAAEALLRAHPEVDVLVHGEGEETFRELLLARSRAPQMIDWRAIQGLSFATLTGKYIAAKPRPRQKNLDSFASPFLTGVFDYVLALAEGKGQRFSAVWEPDRGCPFDCAFCAWGSATAAKVNTFGMDRLMAELDWFAAKQIGFVYGASANFGLLFDRDHELAQYMVSLKNFTGYPKRFMVNTSKNATERIFKLSKLLHNAELSKGATLSMQSWDTQTLVTIGRNNIKLDTYDKLQTMFREAGVPTYAELILGLPGESLQSFCDGIDKNLDAGQHDGLFIYLCRVLPGTEMAEEAYRKKHGIETVRLPIQANHGSLDAAQVGPTEYEETVIATKTMPHADWLEAQRVAWFVEVFFVLGIARLPLLWLREQGVTVTEFARWALGEMGKADGSFVVGYPSLGWNYIRLDNYLLDQDRGAPNVPTFGLDVFPPIRWPIEEASWLALMSRKDDVELELARLFDAFCSARGIDNDPLADLIWDNMRRLKRWTDGVSPSDPATFAREILWFGRRGGSMLRGSP